MVVTKATVTFVCVAAVLLHTPGFVSAKHFPFFDKLVALAQIKHATTTPSPTSTNPITAIYIPDYLTYPTTDTLTSPTDIDTPTGTLTDNLNTNTVITPTLTVNTGFNTNTPIITATNIKTNLPLNINTVTNDLPVALTATNGKSYNSLISNLDDEADETIENEVRNLEDYLSAEKQSSSAAHQRQQVRKQQSSKNKRRRPQQEKQNRRPQNTQKKRQQQRRRKNNQNRRHRNEVQYLRRIIRQLLLRAQIQNGNKTPVTILVRQTKNGQIYPERASKVRRMENYE